MICKSNRRLPWFAIAVALWAALASGNRHDRPLAMLKLEAAPQVKKGTDANAGPSSLTILLGL